jgi:hypothetical protein
LNKGVKYLWENGIVDAKIINFKRSISSSSEKMDSNYKFKKSYPALYEDAMKSPLLKSLFKTETVDGVPDIYFTVDPTNGFFAFSNFPEGKEDIDYVLREIIRRNS